MPPVEDEASLTPVTSKRPKLDTESGNIGGGDDVDDDDGISSDIGSLTKDGSTTLVIDEAEAEAESGKKEVSGSNGNALSSASSSSGSDKSVDNRKCVAIEENSWFSDETLTKDDKPKALELEEKRKAWEASDSPDDNTLRIFQHPFKHGEIADFVKNQEFVGEFLKLFQELEFQEKAIDLFQFQQSFDLNSIVDPRVYSISQYLTDKVLPFMKKLTGLPLNQTIDMFLSIYKQTDFLLCHDDELDSRRIAFIWYLSEDWSEDDGGTLDLFSATDSLHPEKVVKKIVPEYNKFVFFEVGATSFHQVSEVLKEGKARLALSGWFYGEPLPRPTIEFPYDDVPHNVLETFKDVKGIVKKLCHEDYLDPEMHKELNKELCEESQLLIPSFFLPDAYKRICESIVDADVAIPNFFKRREPVNLVNFEEAISGPSNRVSSSTSGDINVGTLRDLFQSTEFLTFLESVTEFPFTTLPTNRVVSSLHKYAHGSYTLLKGGVKQTGLRSVASESDKKLQSESDNEEEEEEPNFVDLLFYFAHKWCDEWGGEEIFCSTEDEGQQQLMSIQPEGNALALAVRTSNVSSFTKYVNCLAKENVYFVYKMTFAFNGKFE